MNVNQKGSIGLIKVVADLYSKGYHCFTPFDDYSPVDCIAMSKDGKTIRLQVKYRSPGKNDRYEVAATTVVNSKICPIDRGMIDYWAVYLSDIDRIVYFPVSLMEGKKVHYITRAHIENGDVRLLESPF